MKQAAYQDFPVRLDRDRKDLLVRARVESRVERAVRIQPGQVLARHTQNAVEGAADENLAVRLNGNSVNPPPYIES